MKKDCLILGGIMADLYYEIENYPDRGQDTLITGEYVAAGGCSLNMAVTAANLGAEPYVVSCIGNDGYGDMLRSYMREHGLPDTYVKTLEQPSGKCLIFSEPDGERTFMTEKGAEAVFPQSLADEIRGNGFLSAGVTGYYLLGEDAGRAVDLIRDLKAAGTKILFDPGPLAMDIDPDVLHRMMGYADIMTPNSSEMKFIFENEEEIQRALDAGTTLIIKKGGSGGRVIAGHDSFDYSAEPAEAVDTTGAGDSFAGSLLYSMARGRDIRKAVKLAARCAAVTVAMKGPHGFWKLEE